MFCTHHDEDDVLGLETLPCPLCGYGTPLEKQMPGSDDPLERLEDSNDALRYALTGGADNGRSSRLVNARHYW